MPVPAFSHCLKEASRSSGSGGAKVAPCEQREIACELGDDADFVAVLQILADAGQIGHDRDAEAFQLGARSDAGKLQQLRTVERAARQNDFAARTHLACAAERPASAVRSRIGAIDVRLVHDIRPRSPACLRREPASRAHCF